MKKYITILLCTALIISVFTNLGQRQKALTNPRNNIIGTYCAGEQVSPDAEYFAFDSDGIYWRYHQFNIIEQGTYTLSEGDVYTLTPNAGEITVSDIVYTDYTPYCAAALYRYDPKNGKMIKYEKISDTCLLINISETL